MKKKFDRLFRTKTTENNSDKQTELGEKMSRRSELAKKAIDAICNDRPSINPAALAVETGAIPIQEIQPRSRIDAEKEAESKLEQKVMITIQRQIEVLTEKIDRIKDETAEKVAEVTSKLEQKTTEYSEAVTNIRSEVAEIISEERKNNQQQIAESIAELKAAAAEAESRQPAMCECCGRDGITKNMLVKIDSGQLLCPVCFQAIKGFRS